MIPIVHNKGCTCIDCQDDYIQELQAKYFKPNFIDATGRSNHADAVSKPPSYFIDSILIAKEPVKIYKVPNKNGTVVNNYPKGAQIGRIYSWVQGTDGLVWWDVNYFSGKHAGFVPNDQKFFNQDVLNSSSSGLVKDQQHDAAVKIINEKSTIEKVGEGVSNAISGTADALGSIGSNLKWILLAVVIVVVILAVLKFSK